MTASKQSQNVPSNPLIIPLLFCSKILYVSGIFCAHHQEFSAVHSALVSFMQVSDDRFQAEWGWNCNFQRSSSLECKHFSQIRDSVEIIVTGLRTEWPRERGSILDRGKRTFFFSQSFQIVSWAHPTYCSDGTRCCFLRA